MITEASSLFSRMRRSQNLAFSVIFMVMLIDVMGMTILFPVSVFIVQKYSSEALMYILLNVIYSAAQFLAAPVLGNLSDRLGRRPILLVCLFGAGLGYLVFGFAGALWVLFLARLIGGITGGSISTASAYIVDVSAPEERARRLTLVGMAWGVGLVAGPALGGFLGQMDLRMPAFCAAAFCLLNLCLGFFVLPESLPVERRVSRPMRARDFNSLSAIGRIGRLPGIAILLAAQSVFSFAFNGMNSTESLFMINKFQIEPWQLGAMTMIAGLALAIVQMALVPRLVPRFGEKNVATASLLLMGVWALATCNSPIFLLVYPVVLLRSSSSGMVFPTLGSLSSRRVSASEQGALAGVNTALQSLTGIFSPLLASVLYDHLTPAGPYWMAAALFLAAALLMRAFQNTQPAAS